MTDHPTALDRYLALPHRKTCTFWVFSGDRHCSCGRDAAQAELEELRRQQQPIEIQPALFTVQVKEMAHE